MCLLPEFVYHCWRLQIKQVKQEIIWVDNLNFSVARIRWKMPLIECYYSGCFGTYGGSQDMAVICMARHRTDQ